MSDLKERMYQHEWDEAARQFAKAVEHHRATICERDVDLVGPDECCIIAGLVAAAPYMKSDPTLGIVIAYELGIEDGKRKAEAI